MLRHTLPLLLLLAAPALAHAQIGIYGEFSTQNFNIPNVGWQYGTTFGLFDDRWHIPFFALGLDGRGSVVRSGGANTTSGFGGPRLVFQPHVLPVMPFVEALVGVSHVGLMSGPPVPDSQTEFAYQFLGGVDWTIFPRLDWRVAEFSYGSLAHVGYDPKTISTGIVFRLP